MKRVVKKTEEFILHYWLVISSGMILTVSAVKFAYIQRGYMAFGGEYLVLPVLLVTANLLENIFCFISDFFYKAGIKNKR